MRDSLVICSCDGYQTTHYLGHLPHEAARKCADDFKLDHGIRVHVVEIHAAVHATDAWYEVKRGQLTVSKV